MPPFAALTDPYLFWPLAALCALSVGYSKAGVPGIGILVIPVMAIIFDPDKSTGVLLPLLIVGDIFTVTYYRRHAVWRHVLRCLPWAVGGIVTGWLVLRSVDFRDAEFKRIIGGLVLAVLLLGAWVRSREDALHIPHTWWFAAIIGLLGGFSTMAANAAGPIWMIYLLAMNLPKDAFLGTGGWTFMILNVFKLPFFYDLGRIDTESLWYNLQMAPVVILGGILGVYTARVLPQKVFRGAVTVLAAAAALKLLWG